MKIVTLYLCTICSFFLAGCHTNDLVVPNGVSTFVSYSDFNKSLNFDFIPVSLALNKNGDLYVAGFYQIVKVTPNGHVSLFAGGAPGYKNGKVPDVTFGGISCLAFDQKGNLFVGEQYNNCIRKIDTNGQVSLFAGKPNWALLPSAFDSPDGPDSSAHFVIPTALVVDSVDNLLETETGFIGRISADCLRKITPSGYVKTIAGKTGDINAGVFNDEPAYFQRIAGLAIGTGDTIFVSDSYNALIRVVTANGIISTVAGTGRRDAADGPRKQAGFIQPTALAFRPKTGLYIADQTMIRLLSPDGQVRTLTGSTESGLKDGSFSEARFSQITDMQLSTANILYLIDSANRCIRRVNLSSN